MRIEREYDGQVAIFTKAGPIHRPTLYLMRKDCGWQWERFHKTSTGHWTFVLGPIVFTTM